MGTLNTYAAHEQVGLFAVTSLLIGDASVTKATFGQALLGTFLFHLLFIISPVAGQNLMNNGQIGKFFRVFIAYDVIGIALALHAWHKKAE
ncbi:putative inner-membrane translocator [Gottschalkia acidurici 9a]|uniref:Inner-membrane translocator n=1 Tax=Gottschalkia acidurici (strain ATCC 7906 / DSM 604 / BCRC 14475 / CIP 104303 / KCTC 5404 / NCIMB 10678 / 9a) TaxID=1128398 RepID=K0AXE3_GOTA9|nr:ABC transporter permease [Gottschalkia acidurici]AFS77116.1 putative inner-membrane translocator [Gottschalkia acidurici 9a]